MIIFSKLFADGTIQYAPKYFYQLYIIHNVIKIEFMYQSLNNKDNKKILKLFIDLFYNN